MKIVFFEVEPWEKPVLRRRFGEGHELVLVEERLNIETWEEAKGAEVVSVFVDSQVSGEVIDHLSELKMIATRSTGFDHIDMEKCKARGIVVSTVPSYGENTVAEHTFGLILAISRKIYETIERTERGRFDLDGLRGFDLRGKTIGIYGLGSIGKHVARMARGFEMRILAYARTKDEFLADMLGIEYVETLDEILGQSDIITLHCPLVPATEHLINKDNIGKIKKGAVLINTARGGLVETEALLMALNEGILAGAGLDVLEEEKPLKEELHLLSKDFHQDADLKTLLMDHVLIAREDVVFTAHNAFNSEEAVRRILETTCENIEGFLSGDGKNVVG